MRQPESYLASTIKKWGCEREMAPGLYVPARPVGHNAWSFTWRWVAAWNVLIGKWDCVVWDGQDDNK